MTTLEESLTMIQLDTIKNSTSSGVPLHIFPITIFLWLDTDQKTCEPITGTMKVRFNVNASKFGDIIRAIDKATPVYKIKRKHATYHITKIEEFMNKRCEA